jgi:enoyl-CoA hydratase/carnithine racemase
MNDILIHSEAGVLTLTFNRVDKKNAITVAMYGVLADQLREAAADPRVRVVVLQGDVTVFTAGNDIADFQKAAAAGQTGPLEERPVGRFLEQIATFPKPLIAAVCGPAVGVGATMLLHCDLVYAGDNAAFSFPFVNLGVIPEAGSTLLAPQLFGYHRAAEILLTGDPFMAEAALEVGFVNRVLPPTECNPFAQEQARRLAAKPLTSLIETKRLLKAGQHDALLARIRDEGVVFNRLLQGPASREAFAAFMQKRKPDFSAC